MRRLLQLLGPSIVLSALSAACGGSIDARSERQQIAASEALMHVAAIDAAMLGPAGAAAEARPAEDPSAPQPLAVPPPVMPYMPRPIAVLLDAWRAPVGPDCVLVGPSADEDGDGVPARYDATLACESQDVAGGQASIAGRIVVTDRDDTVPDAAMIARFEGFTVRTVTADGEIRSRTIDGEAHLTREAAGVFVVAQKLRIAFERGHAGDIVAGTYTGETTTRFVADDGDGFASGSVVLHGAGTLIHDGESHRLVHASEPSLRWSLACRTRRSGGLGFEGGTLVVTSDQGGPVRHEYRSCEEEIASARP
jgi:hypothetical protein